MASILDDNQMVDCVVIGAGPAGAMAARQIAQKNKKVLLLDKETFPRKKVCGCCINASALNVLDSVGLQNILLDGRAHHLSHLRLYNDKKSADISFLDGYALSRERFDFALVKAGIQCGVEFLQEASAKVINLDPLPKIQIKIAGLEKFIYAKVVIVADGLSGKSLDLLPQFLSSVNNDSRFGISVILDQAPEYIKSGTIHMACGEGGYVGMVTLEDGRLNLAAALDHNFCKTFANPGMAIASLLKQNDLPEPSDLLSVQWKGTNLLTRHRAKISGQRIFVIGDACGYVEPFTGEGMYWALRSGLDISSLALEGIDNWIPELEERWTRMQTKTTIYQTRCRILTLALRNKLFRAGLIQVSSLMPIMVDRIAQFIAGANQKRSARGLI